MKVALPAGAPRIPLSAQVEARPLPSAQAPQTQQLPIDPKAQLFPPGAEAPASPAAGGRPLAALGLKDRLATGVDEHLKALRLAIGDKNTYLVDTQRGKSGVLDLEAIAGASFFSMLLDGAKADDALVASGVALARGVPSLYIVPERKHLPWFLREADQTYPGLVRIIEEPIPSTLKRNLKRDKDTLFGAPAAPPPNPPSTNETFLGCLMSGLDKEQYAEGRGHLVAIDEVLREKLGAAKTHCEGIQVATTTAFGTPKESLAMDVEAVRRADRCVFYLYDGQPRPSGMWVEAGVALGLEKPCTFLVPDEAALPPCLRAGARPDHVKVVVYGDHTNLKTQLAADPAATLIG